MEETVWHRLVRELELLTKISDGTGNVPRGIWIAYMYALTMSKK